jgi:predicted RNA binding protein YcfA (HicA-like mRNA interferase family)
MPPLPRVSGREIVRALRNAGWTLERIQGSHHIMQSPDGRVVSVPVHGAKTLPVGTIKRIVDRVGLSVEEFIELL